MLTAAMKLKVMTNLDSLLKSRDITLPNKGPSGQGYILSPCLFNLYAEYFMQNAGLDEVQAGVKIAGRKSITSDMQMTPPLWQKVKKT